MVGWSKAGESAGWTEPAVCLRPTERRSDWETAGMPHLEFTVVGPPVSHQTKDRANLNDWKGIIRAEAAKAWAGKPPLTGTLKCTICNFHEGEKASLDDDNMVKPIRDAMNGLIYDDDSQIR